MMSLYRSETSDISVADSEDNDDSLSKSALIHQDTSKLDENFEKQMENDPDMKEAFEQMLADESGRNK